MKTFSFTLFMAGDYDDYEENSAKLYEVIDDATLGWQNEMYKLIFDREAESELEAVQSAKDDVARSGATVRIIAIAGLQEMPEAQ